MLLYITSNQWNHIKHQAIENLPNFYYLFPIHQTKYVTFIPLLLFYSELLTKYPKINYEYLHVFTVKTIIRHVNNKYQANSMYMLCMFE